MARPHSASDVGAVEETAAFLRDLRALRHQAGLGPSELAARAHFPEETLTTAEGGPALPTLPVLEAYVRACDASPVEWEDRWRRLTQGTAAAISLPTRQPSAAKAPARVVPFPGTGDPDESGIPPISPEAMLAAAAEPAALPTAPPPPVPRPAEPVLAEPTVTVPAQTGSSSWFEPTPNVRPRAAPAAAPPVPVRPSAPVPPQASVPPPAPAAPSASVPPASATLPSPVEPLAGPAAGRDAAPADQAPAGPGHRAAPEHQGRGKAIAVLVVVLVAAALAAWLALRG